MLKILIQLVSPLGDPSTTKGKLTIAYKVAQAAFAAWQHFRDVLLEQHPAAPAEVKEDPAY
jgi:hypothetical protein